MRMKDLVSASKGGGRRDLFDVPLHMLVPDPDNIRHDTPDARADMEVLIASILDHGWLDNSVLKVRAREDRSILVIDGNRRLAAVLEAVKRGSPITKIPCVVEPQGMNDGDRALAKALANTGRQNTQLELAEYAKAAMRHGKSEDDICRAWGRTRTWLAGILELAAAPTEVRQAVLDGSVQPTLARALVKSHGAGAAAVIIEAKAASGRSHVTAKHIRAVAPVVAPEPARPVRPAPEVPFVAPTVARDALADVVRAFLAVWDGDNLMVSPYDAVEALRAALGVPADASH